MSGTQESNRSGAEGGSDKRPARRPNASELYPIVMSLRVDKAMKREIEEFATEKEWSLNHAARVLIRRSLQAHHATAPTPPELTYAPPEDYA